MWPLLLWLADPAGACSAEDYTPPVGVEVRAAAGWTRDGRWFVFDAVRHDGDGGTAPAGGILDTHTDAIEIFDEAAYAAWKAAHPVTPGSTADRCDGATAVRRVEDLSGFEAIGDGAEVSLATVGVEALGVTWTHAEYEGTSLPALSWSPGCRHLAWVFAGRTLDEDSDGVGPWNPSGAFLVRPVGPVVHVMAHASARDAVQPVFDALVASGWGPHVGPNALKDRDATVVYATRQARDVAAKIAAAVPGGATVAPLNWPSAADVVVAAGRSALR